MNGAEMVVTGNLVRFELRFGANGNAWGTGSVAVPEFTTKNGERTETTTYVDFKVFGQMAENLAESSDKGTRLVVIGKLRNEKWTASDGTERRSMTLYVDEVATSVRWATAKVAKTTKPGSSGGSPSGDYAPSMSSAPELDGDNPFR